MKEREIEKKKKRGKKKMKIRLWDKRRKNCEIGDEERKGKTIDRNCDEPEGSAER